ncbi:MAG TPA: DUF1990 family protein [Gemmatimonadaceae bacterium]|nr:DUF1990 family protein [Gemmatimonadaceae bacterium]
MKILVTGGTGVVGEAAVTALLAHGHRVRLLSRKASGDSRQWPDNVEAHDGNVADAQSVRGSADGCDAVLHIAGIVDEQPPEVTFERVNIGGTRNMVAEAQRAGARRFVYVSSLGADRGESGYHRSKRRAEEVARTFDGDWLVMRPGNVYGPGDEVISLLLKMVRTLPAVPVIDGGDDPFQPMWAEDLGEAIALAVERKDLARRDLELAGPERTTMNDVIKRLSRITDRSPISIPVPGFLAEWGTKIADKLGIDLPVNQGQLTMLRERNVIERAGDNALVSVFHVTPTPLEEGLKKLADALPEQLPSEGVGAFKRKRFWADIAGSSLTAEALFERFRQKFSELAPWTVQTGVEPGTPQVPDEGETLTLGLPLRGNIQVRVNEMSPRSMTFVTLEGHPLAGAVRFLCDPRGDAGLLRFEVRVYDRPANLVDWLTMTTVGGRMQNATWEAMVERVVELSGGRAERGVQDETTTLEESEAERVEEWLKELVMERKREERAGT